MTNYDELRQAGRDAIAEDDHVCITGELLLQLLDENAALRAWVKQAEHTNDGEGLPCLAYINEMPGKHRETYPCICGKKALGDAS